jgi:ribosome maturation protein SDO1
MTNIEDAVIARLKKQGHTFEVLVDCEKALAFRSGKSSLDDALVTTEIFKDVKKGEHAPENIMKNIFNTDDKKKIAEIIIKQGEIQLTTEYKHKLREEKRKQIISLISRNAIDPKTNLPHPPQRIENALEEAKVKIDEFKSAEEQVPEIIKKISAIIPISYEIKQFRLGIPPEVAGRSYPLLKHYATIKKEDWLSDGTLLVDIEAPAGLMSKLFDELNKLAHGRIESREI